MLDGACCAGALGGVGEVRDSRGAEKRDTLLTGHFLDLSLGPRLDANPRRANRRDHDWSAKRTFELTVDQPTAAPRLAGIQHFRDILTRTDFDIV
jgi:hypothetical protein